MISGHDRVVVERADGTLVEVDPVADSDEELVEFLQFLAARAENPRSFTSSQPSLHLRLPDGSRLAAARDTARLSVVIRRHRVRRVTLEDLVDWGTLSPTMAGFLAAAVRARRFDRGVRRAGRRQDHAGAGVVCRDRPVGGDGHLRDRIRTVPARDARAAPDRARVGGTSRFGGARRHGPLARGASHPRADHRQLPVHLVRQILGEIRGPEVWSMIKLMESGPGRCPPRMPRTRTRRCAS